MRRTPQTDALIPGSGGSLRYRPPGRVVLMTILSLLVGPIVGNADALGLGSGGREPAPRGIARAPVPHGADGVIVVRPTPTPPSSSFVTPTRTPRSRLTPTATRMGTRTSPATRTPTPSSTPTDEPAPPRTPTRTFTKPPTPTRPAEPPCSGDCDGDGQVSVAEFIVGINIVLGTLSASRCPAFDADADGHVRLIDLTRAVLAALPRVPCDRNADGDAVARMSRSGRRPGDRLHALQAALPRRERLRHPSSGRPVRRRRGAGRTAAERSRRATPLRARLVLRAEQHPLLRARNAASSSPVAPPGAIAPTDTGASTASSCLPPLHAGPRRRLHARRRMQRDHVQRARHLRHDRRHRWSVTVTQASAVSAARRRSSWCPSATRSRSGRRSRCRPSSSSARAMCGPDVDWQVVSGGGSIAGTEATAPYTAPDAVDGLVDIVTVRAAPENCPRARRPDLHPRRADGRRPDCRPRQPRSSRRSTRRCCSSWRITPFPAAP